MNDYTIVFDVGGLFIKAAVLNQHGKVVPNTYAVYPAKSKGTKGELLNHFADLIKQQLSMIMDKYFQIKGIGYAFPGPFDYEEGICYINGVDKFEAIYGVNLREDITGILENEPFFKQKKSKDFRIVFENDANLFALGEIVSGKAKPYHKSICITIGTGLGSAFIENGKLVKNRQDVPENGWIYCTPFRSSIADDYISKRGYYRLQKELGIDSTNEIKDLAEMARKGDEELAKVFRNFGEQIGNMLIPFLDSFQPQAIIIGGQIAKSHDLFLEGCRDALEGYDVTIETSEETSISTFIGVSKLLEQTNKTTA